MIVSITIIISLLCSNIAPTVAMAGNQAVWRHVLNADLTEYQGERFPISLAESEENPVAIDVLPDEEKEESYEEEYEEDNEVPGADGLITYRTPMPTDREGLGVVAVGKKIYAIGGQFNSTYYNKLEIYDTVTDTWTTGTNMTYGVSYFSCVAVGTNIYCIGGYNGTYRNYLQVYDTVNNAWTTKTQTGTQFPALMATAAVEYNGSIFVSGGYDGSFRNYVYQYNIAANTWTSRSGLLNARAYHNAFIYDGKMYIEGGANSPTGSNVQIEEIYNLSAYSAIANGTSRVGAMNAAVIINEDRLIVIGGSNYLNGSYLNRIVQRSMLDSNTSYRRMNIMTAARASLGAAMVDGVVYMIGGRNSQYVFNTVEAMEAGYTYLAEMPQKLRDFSTCELAGNIYAAGGYAMPGNTASRAMYTYNILNKTWEQKADLPLGTTSNLISSVYGKLYLFDRNSSNADRVFAYDPQSDTWTDIAAAPGQLSKVQALNGKIYGMTGGSRTVDVFDPLTNTWSQAALRPNTAGFYDNSNPVVLLGKLYIYCSNQFFYCYDPVADSWSTVFSSSDVFLLSPIYQDLYLFSPNYANKSKYILKCSLNEKMFTNYISFLPDYEHFYSICTVNNKAYIFAGQNSSGGAEVIIEYMPSASPWAVKQPPFFANGYMASAAIGDKIYLAGGYGYINSSANPKYMNELYEYDTLTDTWVQKDGMLTARSKVAGAAANDKFYVIGGEINGSGTATNVAEEYNPSTNQWATKAVLPYSAHSIAAAVYNGKIYTFGGRSGAGGAFDYVREYDPVSNQWSTAKAAMPTARCGASAVELNGKIYVAGGFNSSGTALKTLEVYDPVTNTWDSTKADMPMGKGYCGVVADEGIYLIGGDDGFNSVNTVYQYNPNVDKWYHWPGADNALEGAAAVALNNGIYVISGVSSSKNPGGSSAYSYIATNYYSPTSSIASFAELTHLGSDGITPSGNLSRSYSDLILNPSGNLSRQYSDLSFDAPGFIINASRIYNSIDTRDSLISKGWSFGFSSKLETLGNDTVIRMPNGSASFFKTENDGTYTAKDSRSKLTKSGAEHILTTKNHYQYRYNTNGYLDRMTDPNGNQVNLSVNTNGQVTQVTDSVGRTLSIAYTSNRISTITESGTGRQVSYTYDGNGRLSQVTAPDGGNTYYTYNSDGLLWQVKDHNNAVVEEFTYETQQGREQNRVRTVKKPTGNTETYNYDVQDDKVTTVSEGRTTTTYFDKALYPISVMDAEGGQQRFEYNLDGGINRYGEIKASTDRNGNTTFNEYDARGNVVKTIYPNRSIKLFDYDANDNLISETDELGHKTFCIYDDNNNLLKRIKPLDGVSGYSSTAEQSLYAIETYTYYTPVEANAMCGRSIGGLLKTFTDAAGNIITYTYDGQGNLATSTDSLNRTTTYSFNILGWLKQQTSPMGYSTKYYYDKCGRLLKKVQHGGESERYVYDLLGNLTQSISPEQYSDITDATTYSIENIVNTAAALVSTVGFRYTYNSAGLVITDKDPLSNTASYTYDNFGNKTEETLPNGLAYIYTYDKLDRFIQKSSLESGTTTTLESYSYPLQTDGTVKETTRVYFSSTDYADTTYIYDFANRLLKTINPDGGEVSNTYLANGLVENTTDAMGHTTYFEYDPMNQMTKRWAPHDGSLYSLTEWFYDGAGRIKGEMSFLTPQTKGVIYGDDVIYTAYTYNIDSTVKEIVANTYSIITLESTVEGIEFDNDWKTSYLYNNDGQISQENKFQGIMRSQQTSYTYNYWGKIATATVYVENKDINGKLDDSTLFSLTTGYAYDKSSNLEKITYPNGEVLSYEYDLLNRQTAEKRNILNENNVSVTVNATTAYDNMGNITSTKDEKENITYFTYSPRGFLLRVTDAQNAVTAREYDLQGRLLKEYSPRALLTDEPGHIVNPPANAGNWDNPLAFIASNYTAYVYDKMDRLLSKSEYYRPTYTSAIRVLVEESNTYDKNGNLLTTKDALNNTTSYTYGNAGRVTKVSNALSQDTQFSYDGMGRLIQQTDARNVVTQYTYDRFGKYDNVIRQSVDGVKVMSATYDLLGNCLTASDANGNTTTYTYTLTGQIRDVTNAAGYNVCYWYDVMGNTKRSLDSLGKEVINDYDSWGRLLSVTQQSSDGANTISRSTRYDVLGNPVYEVDERGNTTQYSYDKLSKIISVKNPLNQTSAFAYDANGNKVSETNWRGNTKTYRYDILNRQIAIIDPDGVQAETLTYTDTHRQATSTDALGHTSSFTYDKLGRLIAVTEPEGYSNSQNYDAVGNIISKTDGNNQVTSFSYDNFNRLTSVTDADDAITRFGYDAVGNLLSQTDGRGNTTRYEYNELNQPILHADPGALYGEVYDESRVERYTYYPDGKLYSRRDRNGAITSYEYDIHGRKTGKYVNGAVTSYEYDNTGNLLEVMDVSGAIVRTYDQLNRVVSKTVPVFGTTSFGYDLISGLEPGQIGECTTIDGLTVTRVYDKTGRLAQVKDGSDETDYEYYDNGCLKTQTLPNGVTANYTYFDNNKLQTLENKRGGLILEAYQYTYDGVGNMKAKQDVKGTTVYTYTPVDQLASVSEPSGKLTTYTYDASGNRQSETVTGDLSLTSAVSVTPWQGGQGQSITTTYEVNEQNRLISTEQTINAQKIIEQYCYDDAGNMLSCLPTALNEAGSSEGSLGISLLGQMEDEELTPALYSYNDKNQMVQAINGSATVSNTFNAEGLRSSKTANDITTNYCYEYSRVIKEQDSEGSMAYNVYGTNLISRELDGEKVYYIYNGHGDVTGLLSESGTEIASYYYDAFGNITEQSGNCGNPYRYAGYIYDAESSLYNLNARFYDARIARFLQADTYLGNAGDPLSLNLYAYCLNNPIKYVDPTGHVITATDKANLTSSQIAAIEKATADWNKANAAGDTAGMKAANDAANAIRASAGCPGSSNSNSINVGSGNTVENVIVNYTIIVYYVSPTDRANLSAAQIRQLEYSIKDYESARVAGDAAAMKAANDAAYAIRTSAAYSDGNSTSVSSGNAVKAVTANGTTTENYVSYTDKTDLTSSQIAAIEKATVEYEKARAAGDTVAMKAVNDVVYAIKALAAYFCGSNSSSITAGSSETTTVTEFMGQVQEKRSVINFGCDTEDPGSGFTDDPDFTDLSQEKGEVMNDFTEFK